MSNFHVVRRGENLSMIAKQYGTTVTELRKLNSLQNPNRLDIGQRIALRKEAVCGFEALFLDADRNPIAGLEYVLEYCGRSITGTTGKDGKARKILTDTPADQVRILVKRFDGTLKEITTVMSGYWNKLVTLVSPLLVIDAELQPHPKQAERTAKNERIKPAHDPHNPAAPTTNKKELGLKGKQTTTADGKPVTVVEGDIPGLDEFLDSFNEELMNDADYAWAAKELGVEEAAIRAYAKVESGAEKGAGFIQVGKRKVPTILYERHKFSQHTEHQYSGKYPDISLPNGYYFPKVKYVLADDDYKKKRGVPTNVQYYRPINKKDGEETRRAALTLKELLDTGKVTKAHDLYLAHAANYKRLAKAYQLDKAAALKSCSWGAFQIMGEYWETMKYSSIFEFTKAMSRSEREQIRAFVRYIKYVNPAIIGYLNKHDWARAAEAYNGPRYKQNSYDTKLAAEYKKFKERE